VLSPITQRHAGDSFQPIDPQIAFILQHILKMKSSSTGKVHLTKQGKVFLQNDATYLVLIYSLPPWRLGERVFFNIQYLYYSEECRFCPGSAGLSFAKEKINLPCPPAKFADPKSQI